MLAYEDMTVGRTFALGPRSVEADEIVAFASQFDPQPFHLDATSAQAQQTGGLIASGWHTCAMFMGMLCEAILLGSTSEGSSGVDEVRWRAPIRPGDTLTGETIITQARRSASRPNVGIVGFDATVQNQHGTTVATFRSMGFFGVREVRT